MALHHRVMPGKWCNTKGIAPYVVLPMRFFLESSQRAWCGLVGEFIRISFPVF